VIDGSAALLRTAPASARSWPSQAGPRRTSVSAVAACGAAAMGGEHVPSRRGQWRQASARSCHPRRRRTGWEDASRSNPQLRGAGRPAGVRGNATPLLPGGVPRGSTGETGRKRQVVAAVRLRTRRTVDDRHGRLGDPDLVPAAACSQRRRPGASGSTICLGVAMSREQIGGQPDGKWATDRYQSLPLEVSSAALRLPYAGAYRCHRSHCQPTTSWPLPFRFRRNICCPTRLAHLSFRSWSPPRRRRGGVAATSLRQWA